MTTTESATRRCGQQYAAGLVNRWCDLPRFHAGFHSGHLEHAIRREHKAMRETAGVPFARDTCACGWRSCWYRESVNAEAASARHLCEYVGDGAAR